MPPMPEPMSTPKRVAVHLVDVEPGVLDRHRRARRSRTGGRGRASSGFLLVDVLQRLEALDLAGDPGRIARWCRTG